MGTFPDDGVVVATDAAAAAVLDDARRARQPMPALGLVGGDLYRTLGGRAGTGIGRDAGSDGGGSDGGGSDGSDGSGDGESRLRAGPVTIVPVDLGEALVDGRLHRFVAHVVVRRGWWRGPVTAVMNAQYLGRWDVAPRAHPNDGLLDVVEVDASMGIGERWKAWRRLPAGTHVPHPRITVRRLAAVQLDAAGRHVWIDGVDVGPAHSLSVRVEPDALTCAVSVAGTA